MRTLTAGLAVLVVLLGSFSALLQRRDGHLPSRYLWLLVTTCSGLAVTVTALFLT